MIYDKIQELVESLEIQAQARISRTEKLYKRWSSILNSLNAQYLVEIDYTEFASDFEAKKYLFGRLFQIHWGGIRTILVDFQSIVTNVTVRFFIIKHF